MKNPEIDFSYTENKLSIDSNTEDDNYSHPPQHASLYKTPGTKISQNERRKALLQDIKARRNNIINEKRGINELFLPQKDVIEEEPMDYSVKKKRKHKFNSKLMLSEYLIEKPEDLESNWTIKICPKGSRNLVVANHGRTMAYNKTGKIQAEFESFLPGGGGSTNRSKFTILDCIYNYNNENFYVLDVLAWNSFSLINCSTDFRFFFLHSKFEENSEILQKSMRNPHPFIEVSFHGAELALLENILSFPKEDESHLEIDGILFYHNEMHYKHGCTPLVGWLKPYMVPEILNLPVHNNFMLEKPQNYIDLKTHIEYGRMCRKKGKKEKVHDVEMVEGNEEMEML